MDSGALKIFLTMMLAVSLETSSKIEKNLLTEKDIEHLPLPVQKYLRYAGVINKEKVNNVKNSF